MTNRYIVRTYPSEDLISDDTSDFLKHAQDAYIRKLNYDKQKRHEKYIRDRDAGKTGFKGVRARTSNPYGNYASLYYNPEKAAEYYRTHRGAMTSKTRSSAKNKSKTSGAPVETINDSGSMGGSGGGSGSVGSDGSGGSGNAANAQAAKRAIQDKIKKLRENSQFETAAQRKATQIKVEELRKALEAKLESLNNQREEAADKGQKERETLTNKANAKIEKEQELKKKNIEQDTKKLKNKKEATLDPIRKDNAELRGRLDSMSKTSDPKLKAQLLRKLIKNNEKINKANADYTDSLSAAKTQHSEKMRRNITTIRADLQNAKLASSAEQRSKTIDIRNKIAKLRLDNKNAITNAQDALKTWISNEKTRVAKETARLKGEEYKDPTAENKAYEKRVEARANEILGRGSTSSGKSTSGSTGSNKNSGRITKTSGKASNRGGSLSSSNGAKRSKR